MKTFIKKIKDFSKKITSSSWNKFYLIFFLGIVFISLILQGEIRKENALLKIELSVQKNIIRIQSEALNSILEKQNKK